MLACDASKCAFYTDSICVPVCVCARPSIYQPLGKAREHTLPQHKGSHSKHVPPTTKHRSPRPVSLSAQCQIPGGFVVFPRFPESWSYPPSVVSRSKALGLARANAFALNSSGVSYVIQLCKYKRTFGRPIAHALRPSGAQVRFGAYTCARHVYLHAPALRARQQQQQPNAIGDGLFVFACLPACAGRRRRHYTFLIAPNVRPSQRTIYILCVCVCSTSGFL